MKLMANDDQRNHGNTLYHILSSQITWLDCKLAISDIFVIVHKILMYFLFAILFTYVNIWRNNSTGTFFYIDA